MKILQKEAFLNNGFFPLQNEIYLDKYRKAGKIASKALSNLEQLVINKTKLSLKELDELTEKFIIDSGSIPTFKNYNKFPASVCISVNKQLVHGIPSDYCLQDGDIVTFDLGVTLDDVIADTAATFIYGNSKQNIHVNLLKSTKEALEKGISSIVVNSRMGVIGNAIYKHAHSNGFSVITKYGGHAISHDGKGNSILHSQPFISNKDNTNNGIRIQAGMVLAIEPMLCIGDPHTYVDTDGWTVVGNNISAHFEHTIFVHNDHVEVLT